MRLNTMRKLLILFALLNCSYCGIFAQANTADSLKRLLATEKQDTSRVLLMYQLSRLYVFSKPDTALLVNRQGVELAHKINFKKGEATCLRGIGGVFVNTGNYPAALATDLEALKIAEEIHNEQIIATLLRGISDVYFYQGDIQRSVEYGHRAIAI